MNIYSVWFVDCPLHSEDSMFPTSKINKFWNKIQNI